MEILADMTGPGGGPQAERLVRTAVQVFPGQLGSGGLAVATLISWLVTASFGGYMLRAWIVRGGLARRRQTGDGPPPKVIFSHFGLAVTGLVLWAAFVASGWAPLAWAGGLMLLPVFGLGISTLTLWTPYPAPRPLPGPSHDGAADAPDPAHGPGAVLTKGMLSTPAEDLLAWRLTDEVLAKALTDDVVAGRLADMAVANAARQPPARDARGHLAPLVAIGHGFAAIATVLLTMLTVVSTVLPPAVPAPTGRGRGRVAWRGAADGVLGADAGAVRRHLRRQRGQGFRAGQAGRADGGPGPRRRGGRQGRLGGRLRGLRRSGTAALTPDGWGERVGFMIELLFG